MSSPSPLQQFIEQEKLTDKSILYTVLDWGLGHASRSIPFIEALIEAGNEITIGANGESAHLLKSRFPFLRFHDLPGKNIRYTSNKVLLPFKIASQAPSFLRSVKEEHTQVKTIVEQEKTEVIISDHRYGSYHDDRASYFLTHQLNLPTPVIAPGIQKLHKSLMGHFNALIVPDIEGRDSLAGKLSERIDTKADIFYIGSLSRFTGKALHSAPKDIESLAILSGPEPTRTELETALIKDFSKDPSKNHVLIRGHNKPTHISYPKNVEVLNHASDDKFVELISRSKKVISRSGYSSIMDYQALGIKAELIPTPGQAEQEYLAKRWSGKQLPKPASSLGSQDKL